MFAYCSCGTLMNECGDKEWTCPKCGNYAMVDPITDELIYKYDCDKGIESYSDDDMPEICEACGNPAYPDCFNSCPRVND